jgi:hypothetical protein
MQGSSKLFCLRNKTVRREPISGRYLGVCCCMFCFYGVWVHDGKTSMESPLEFLIGAGIVCLSMLIVLSIDPPINIGSILGSFVGACLLAIIVRK